MGFPLSLYVILTPHSTNFADLRQATDTNVQTKYYLYLLIPKNHKVTIEYIEINGHISTLQISRLLMNMVVHSYTTTSK